MIKNDVVNQSCFVGNDTPYKSFKTWCILDIIQNDPATIIIVRDIYYNKYKIVVKQTKNDVFDWEIGLLMALAKAFSSTNEYNALKKSFARYSIMDLNKDIMIKLHYNKALARGFVLAKFGSDYDLICKAFVKRNYGNE